MKANIASMKDLQNFAVQIYDQLEAHENRATIITLEGDLGSGKTTLVQALGALFGITHAITSPTYTIMQSYDVKNGPFLKLVHMDAYRIDTDEEMIPLRFAELCATPHTLICIEWAEKIQSHIPVVDVRVQLAVSAHGDRTGTLFTT